MKRIAVLGLVFALALTSWGCGAGGTANTPNTGGSHSDADTIGSGGSTSASTGGTSGGQGGTGGGAGSTARTCDKVTCSATGTCPSERLWELHATGDATVDVIDRGSYERFWDSDGNLALYNALSASSCGYFYLSGGTHAKAGSFTFATSPLDLRLSYGGKSYLSSNSGAQGEMAIHEITWCKDFECTVVDLTFDGTLTTSDGAQVEVQGFVKGSKF